MIKMLLLTLGLVGCGSADTGFSGAVETDAAVRVEASVSMSAGGSGGAGPSRDGSAAGNVGTGGAWPAECGVSTCSAWLSGPPWPEIHCKDDTDCCRNQFCDGLLPSKPDQIGLCISKRHENDAGRALLECVADAECVCGFHCSLARHCEPGP